MACPPGFDQWPDEFLPVLHRLALGDLLPDHLAELDPLPGIGRELPRACRHCLPKLFEIRNLPRRGILFQVRRFRHLATSLSLGTSEYTRQSRAKSATFILSSQVEIRKSALPKPSLTEHLLVKICRQFIRHICCHQLDRITIMAAELYLINVQTGCFAPAHFGGHCCAVFSLACC